MSQLATLAAGSESVESEPSALQENETIGKLGELSVFPFQETEEASQATLQYLMQANEGKEGSLDLSQLDATWISSEEIELHHETHQLLERLADGEPKAPLEGKRHTKEGEISKPQSKSQKQTELPKTKSGLERLFSRTETQTSRGVKTPPRKTFSSLFELAKTSRSTPSSEKKESDKRQETLSKQETLEKRGAAETKGFQKASTLSEHLTNDRQQDEGSDQQQQKQDQQEKEQKEKEYVRHPKKQTRSQSKISAVAAVSSSTKSSPFNLMASTQRSVSSTEEMDEEETGDIFYKFMALMARILGQAEAEAHALYKRIKGRTDDIDSLTLLIQKINTESGAIDWSKDEEMKRLVEKARELGVDIPKDKLQWSEAEKKLLKENISMRKDGMEKVTQLERTDMQRYLQEASQCHQARSNLLKLLKEVVDTIVHNIRP